MPHTHTKNISDDSHGELISVQGIETRYRQEGNGPMILIVHGWGSSIDSWIEVQELLAEHGYTVVVLDLPGFGKTPAPSDIWGVEEYARFVKDFIEAMGMNEPVVMGHSFGGQTAIQLSLEYPEDVHALILVAAAGVRRKPGMKRRLMTYGAKTIGLLLYLVPFRDLRENIKNGFYMIIRRRDYIQAQGIMKDIFRKVITQDLTPRFSEISCPVLIMWGKRDQLTPVADAYIMEERIPRATLKVLPNVGHSINFGAPDQLAKETVRFLQSL